MTEKDAASILSYFRVKDDGEIAQDTWYSTIKRDTEEAITMAIKALEPRWIPVSEGVPKVTGFYLIQYSREICGDEITVAYYSVEEKESDPIYEWEFKPHCGEYKEVIAWMPLPQPYNAESEE